MTLSEAAKVLAKEVLICPGDYVNESDAQEMATALCVVLRENWIVVRFRNMGGEYCYNVRRGSE